MKWLNLYKFIIKSFDQLKKHNFDQLNFGQVIISPLNEFCETLENISQPFIQLKFWKHEMLNTLKYITSATFNWMEPWSKLFDAPAKFTYLEL